MEFLLKVLEMRRLIFLGMPYLAWYASAIEYDLGSITALLRYLRSWLDSGINPRPDSPLVKEIDIEDTDSLCKLPYFPKHYLTRVHTSDFFEVTNFFKELNPDISRAYAYGNLIEVCIDPEKTEEYLGFIRKPDKFLDKLLFQPGKRKSREIFSIYVSPEILGKREGTIFTAYVTCYAGIILTDQSDEFLSLKNDFRLRCLEVEDIAIGRGDSTNFVDDFFRKDLWLDLLPVNPILILVKDHPHYKTLQTAYSLLGLLIYGGELYNLTQYLMDLATILTLAKREIRHEIFMKTGRINLNPLKLFGVRQLRYIERLYLDFKDEAEYILEFGSKESELVFHTYGIPYFNGMSELYGLFDICLGILPKIRGKERETEEDLSKKMFGHIYSQIKGLQEILLNIEENLEKDLADATTRVSINVAIAALIATMVISTLSLLLQVI